LCEKEWFVPLIPKYKTTTDLPTPGPDFDVLKWILLPLKMEKVVPKGVWRILSTDSSSEERQKM